MIRITAKMKHDAAQKTGCIMLFHYSDQIVTMLRIADLRRITQVFFRFPVICPRLLLRAFYSSSIMPRAKRSICSASEAVTDPSSSMSPARNAGPSRVIMPSA